MTLGSASRINAGTGSITFSNTGSITGSGFNLTVGGANNTTIASIIGASSGNLTKQDAGTLTLSEANTLTGATTVNGGTLVLSGVGRTLAGSAVTTNSTGIFSVTNGSAAASAVTHSNGLTWNGGALVLAPGFTGSALSTIIAGGTLQLGTGGADGYIYMQQARLNTISSIISGPDSSHNLVLGFGNANNTGGVLVLSGNNTYAGGTIVNGSNANSALVIGGTSTLGLSLTAGTSGSFGTGDVALNNIKVLLNRSNAHTMANNFSGTGASVIQQSATGTATLSGNISGTVGVTQSTASSILILSDTNTHTGATTLSAATLQFNGAASMSCGSALTLATGTTLNLRSDTSASFSTAGITSSGAGTYNFDVGNLSSGTGQTLTLAGAMGFSNGSQQINVMRGSNYTLGLGAITHNTSANGASFTINATTAGATLSSFTFGSFGSNLTLQGSNNITLGGLFFGSNGTETINSGATVNLTAADALGYTSGTNVNTINIAGGTLNNAVNANNGFKTNVVITGGTMAETVATTGTSGFDFDAGYGITTNASATSSLISGRVTIRAGTLGFNVADGAAVDDLIVSGVIFENGGNGINKSGAGSMVLSATNTYGGATTVSAGKLVVTGSIANSAVTVSNAATVLASDAAATIGSNLTINNGAILAAGDAGSAGTATVVGQTQFNNGSIFSWNISSDGASYDKLVSASLAGEITPGDAVFRIVIADSGFSDSFWNSGTKTWNNIFTTNGTTAISNCASLFSLSVVNSSFNPITPVNGSFSISGSTLTWSAVPEPTSAFAGLLIGAGLLRRRRKN